MKPNFCHFLGWFVASLGAVSGTRAETVTAPPVSESSLQAVSPASLPTGSAYSQEMFLTELTAQLTARYRVNGDLQVDLIRQWSVPTSAEPLALVVLDAPANLGSTLLVRIRLQAGARTVIETSLLVRVQLLREVWVARTPAERGAPFDPSQFDTRSVDTLRERDTVSTLESTSTDLTFARSVPVGHVLTWRDVAHRALVRKGQVIEVCAIAGSLTVSMKALAMENGTAGETVRVRNLESKKEFSAQVISESRAEVRL